MSDFTRDDAERTNGSGPSPFLESNTGAMSKTYNVDQDTPHDETSWNRQYASDIHIPPDSTFLARPEVEPAQHGIYFEMNEAPLFWHESTNYNPTLIDENEAVASDSYFFPNPDFPLMGYSEAGIFTSNAGVWSYDYNHPSPTEHAALVNGLSESTTLSSSAGVWFPESINTYPAEYIASLNGFDIGSSGNLIPSAYPQQFPSLTPWGQAQTNQNIGEESVATFEDSLQFHQNTFVAPSEFENHDLMSAQYGTSGYPDLLGNLDIYQQVQSPHWDFIDNYHSDHSNLTSGSFEDTNISLHHSIPFSGFEPPAASVAGAPPNQYAAQVFSDQSVLTVFGPSRPVQLPSEGSRKKSEKVNRDFAVVRRWACWKCKRHNKSCDGQTPCSYCINTFGRARILKHPCAKAYFSDFVLANSYFEFPTLYQNLVIEKQNNIDLVRALDISVKLLQRDTLFLTKSSFGIGTNCAISWGLAAVASHEAAISEIMEHDIRHGFNTDPRRIALEIVKTPQNLRRTFKISLHFFEIPGKNFTTEEWLLKRMVFCCCGFFTFQAMKQTELKVPAGFDAQTAKHAAMLNIWLTMRQCEIDLFRYLEGFVNGDISKLETDEIKSVIKVMAYMVNIPASFQLKAHDIVSGTNEEVENDTLHNFRDRHERVRAALFVYICILNEKLPSGTNLWDLFDNSKISQQLRREFQSCLENIDKLLSGFEFWEQSIRKNVRKNTQKIRTYSDILDAIDSSHNPLTANLKDFEDDQDFFHDEDFVRSFVCDNTEVANGIDIHTTGGILDAMANESLEDLCFLMFMPLPDINWTKVFAPVSQEESQEINEDSLQRLGIHTLLTSRFAKTCWATECLDSLSSTEITLPDLVQKAYSRVDGLLSYLSSYFPGIKTEQVLNLISALNEGYRWLEVIEMIGCAEILLTQRSFLSLFASGTPLQRFDIGEIVSSGTDDDFRHLKELLSTSFSWIKKPCAELRGFVELFLNAEYLMALGDLTSAQEIGCQLQKLVDGCFGDPEHVKLKIHRFFDKYYQVIRNPMEDMISKLPSSEHILSLASDLEIATPTTKGASPSESSSSNAQNVAGQSTLPVKAIIQYILHEEYSECDPEH